MKIAVIGAGAMGSIYAALMADAGHEVWAVDTWRDHVDASLLMLKNLVRHVNLV